MQRGRVQDGADAGEAAPDGRAVADRRGHRCERGAEQVEADDLTAAGAQDADERLTQMPGAASYQNPLARHTGTIRGASAPPAMRKGPAACHAPMGARRRRVCEAVAVPSDTWRSG